MGDGDLIASTYLTGQAEFQNASGRPRPYPYDVTQVLVVTDGGAPDTFGVYLLCIPVGTYDFGDPENRIAIRGLCIENMSANETYILEFYRSPDGIAYTPIGAIRFRRIAAGNRSFVIDAPTRPFNNDNMALYARVKDVVGGGSTVTFSLIVARWWPATPRIPVSTGVWPFG